jgi:Ca-activated chloride channel family protein
MNTTYKLMLTACALMAVFLHASEAISNFISPDITFKGTLNTSCIGHSGGTVYLQMEIITGDVVYKKQRPMNICVVLDRSGSMADDKKIDYAKKALQSLIDRLSSDDYLSIAIYDDEIETLLPMQKVTNKRRIKALVDEVYPRNSTNLGGGMQEGFRQIDRNLKREYINRVILMSDGLANVGVTDPHELNRIARRYRNKSISLTTMGVGLDYNENLMLGLAEAGGGNYYFIESPKQLASIFEKELHGLSAVVAQNARIELSLGSGVRINDVIGCEWNTENNTWIIPLGDLYANEQRDLTIELQLPEGAGVKEIASAVLKYDKDFAFAIRYPSFSISIRYTDDVVELEKGKNWDMQAKVDVALSTRKVEEAMKALDEGRPDVAAEQLSDAKSMLQSSPALINSAAGAATMQEQIRTLEEYSKDVQDSSGDARKVKKSIQYKNYQTQKKKK